MKVVINKVYGGFSLSAEGLENYARRKGHEKLYWFTYDYDTHGLKPVSNPREQMFVSAFTVPEPDENSRGFSSRDMPRNDPDLVATIEELGPEVASGSHADLKVVEIPDDVEWTIQEYDGIEWIAEKHRTWS